MSNRKRLDQAVAEAGLTSTRSQASSYIKLGKVTVDGRVITKPGYMVDKGDAVKLQAAEMYVSRAALKLASVAQALQITFKDKVVLDVGSSTGGFTDYALQHGAKKVIAVDVGTKQLHPALIGHPKIDLHEQTDIRDFRVHEKIDIVLADVSFVSLRELLPHIAKLMDKQTKLIAMVKPQFEAQKTGVKHKGVIKNDAMRRKVLKDFESWVKNLFIIRDKADSDVVGSKGNRERFYVLTKQK